jgi:hypothetical protein
MKARSVTGNSPVEINAALSASQAEGFQPTLAIVFISVKQDRKAVCELLTRLGIDVIGATSAGEFTEGHESTGEIALILLDIPRSDYCILLEKFDDRTEEETAATLARKALEKFSKPAFILCSSFFSRDGKVVNGEILVRSFESVVGPQVNLFGGMAGDDLSFSGTWVFTNDQASDYGMVALVLNEEKIDLYGMAISGWKPLGVFMTVTHSEKNLIYTIDHKPALEMYLRYLGEERASSDDQFDFFKTVGGHYPFQVEREGREPHMCTPIGYDKEKEALVCEADVAQGSRFRFSTPPDFDIIETVIDKAGELKSGLQAEAEAMLIFSCAGRLSALGPLAMQENDGLAGVWNVPMAGFYTYGEFGRAVNGKHEFHSTTCSWVALKEK